MAVLIIVEDNLNICCLNPATNDSSRAPFASSTDSRLHHLAVLAVTIFESVANTVAVHPVHDFVDTVKNAASLVISPPVDFEGDINVGSHMADQDLWDFMAQSNIDWENFLPTQAFESGTHWL